MLRIGPVQLRTNLLLAPIAGYCDLAWRTVCRELTWEDGRGLGLACTDLLSPQGLLRGTATSLDLAQTNEFDRPICMQLYGGDAAIMADGARWARDHGATVIDINMGCPVDKVTKKDGGSKLLCIPDTAERIVEAVVNAVSTGPSAVPVTCKLRLGWSNCEPVARTLAPRLVRAGARLITVHGRTAEQKFQGSVDRPGIREVVEAVKAVDPSTPVIGNGDVTEPQHVLTMIRDTGCDGVMIGRGALSRPWIFRDAWSLQTTGIIPPTPSRDQILDITRRYFSLMLEYRDEHYALHHIRRRISWLSKPLSAPLPDSDRPTPVKGYKESVRTAQSADDVFSAIERYREDPWCFSADRVTSLAEAE
ncbi:MAG: tRNA-dihydrouridine synthase [Phycisphaeraceae bacterium]|nr:tRNA-dihydrouridine synthase [Phycisphaeraceae bacterium]